MKELFLTEDNRLGTCMFCGERLKKRLNNKGKGGILTDAPITSEAELLAVLKSGAYELIKA